MKALLYRPITGLTAVKTLGTGLSVPATAMIAAGGTGYAVNDIVTVAGGVFLTPARLLVKSVTPLGVVTVLDWVNQGVATTPPGNPAATTSSGAGTGLTLTITWLTDVIPAGTRAALIQAEAQAIRWRDDGGNPSATLGQPIAAGDSILYDFDSIGALRMTESAASATANVTYYG